MQIAPHSAKSKARHGGLSDQTSTYRELSILKDVPQKFHGKLLKKRGTGTRTLS